MCINPLNPPLCINSLNPPSEGLLKPFILFKPPIWGVGGLTFPPGGLGGDLLIFNSLRLSPPFGGLGGLPLPLGVDFPSGGSGGGHLIFNSLRLPPRLSPPIWGVGGLTFFLKSLPLRRRDLGRGHSYFNASTGFLVAALQLCKLTVASAMNMINKPTRTKIHRSIFVL